MRGNFCPPKGCLDPQLLLKFDLICNKLQKRKSPQSQRLRAFSMELLPRFELGTSSLPRMRSTD